jgi:predicted nucleotidyltransferase component of viral defense system
MSEQISAVLAAKLDSLATYGGTDAETRRNALKEELQFYVLSFVYHHAEYKNWIMYGGSALRIIHGLNRMSVDLDFEVSHEVTEKFLEEFRRNVEGYFVSTYGAGLDFLTVKLVHGRGLLLKFCVADELGSGHPSNQVHVKVDLNHFAAPKLVTERRPINHGQLAFVIVTYSMSTLMASKIAAIFLRGTRGVGSATYQEKGRDIYDLLWYMNRKVVPDLGYLKAKHVEEAKDLRTLFDRLTLKMSNVSMENLRQDLLPLFLNRTEIENWLASWHEGYLRLLEDYRIHTVADLEEVLVGQDFSTRVFSFAYRYGTADGHHVQVSYAVSEYWITFRDGDLSIGVDGALAGKVHFSGSTRVASQEKLMQYATLFYQKTEQYLKGTNHVVFGDSIGTKLIRMTTDKLNREKEVVLSKSALLSCGLDDLLV